jgi:hypothetical protein
MITSFDQTKGNKDPTNSTHTQTQKKTKFLS